MLNIILCDDDRFILSLTKEKLQELFLNNNIPAQLVCTTTESSHALQFMRMNQGDYLVFLDLDFGRGRLNGIDVAKQMKSIQNAVKIVFVTNHHEMAMEVLASGVEPFGFLEKTTDMNRFKEGLNRYIHMALSALKLQEPNENMLELTLGPEETVRINVDQIMYLEAEKNVSHGITYHTIDGSSITVRDSIEQCQLRLGETFLRVHRSVLANRRYIVALVGADIQLANGRKLPCAVRMRNEVKKWIRNE